VTLLADEVFDGEELHLSMPVTIVDGRVVALDTVPGVEPQRLSGLLAPGFIDIQVNGGGGALFNDAPTVSTIARIGAAHARFGTTAFLPTLMTDSAEIMSRAADAVSEALRLGIPGVLGIHFEGPYLSVAKRGVHRAHAIRRISAAEWELFERTDLGTRVVTLAPESVPEPDIERLVELGFLVCLGHSNADFETAQRALQAGATGFTHLFNAMSPLSSREPGMVGAALVDEDSWCGLILDGCHVHHAAAKVALKAKRAGKVMWVTDAMPPVGTEDTEFELFGARVVRSGNQLRDPNGTLAGSVLDMTTAVRTGVRRLQLPVVESLRMASRYPAEFLRLGNEYARIAVNARADLVLLDDDLNLKATWISGQRVH
jgi:N-acetylglucosamine-6-phosphate deacetylase